MKRILLSLLLMGAIQLASYAQQSVSIGTDQINSNAVLWLQGNGSQGLILPVVTNRTSVTASKGMVVFDDSDKKVYYHSGTAWVEVGGGGTGVAQTLTLTGNTLSISDGNSVQIANVNPSTAGQLLQWDAGNARWTTSMPTFPSVGQVLKWNGTTWTPSQDDVGSGSVPALSNGQILTGDGTSNSGTTLSGDATLNGGTLTISNNAINGAKIADGSVSSSEIEDGSINANDLNTMGATNGQVLQFNGTFWNPATLSGGGTVTNVSGTGPISITNPTTTPVISISQANGTTNGFLSSTDWAAFNAKLGTASATGGDLSGTIISPTVIGIQGRAVTSAVPTNGQILKFNGTSWAPASDDVGGGATPTLSNGQILIGNGSSNSGVALSGDASLSAGALTIANNAINSAKISNGSIVDADVNATAAISGSKIIPDFGAQNVSTTGSTSTSQLTISNEIRLGASPGTSGQILTSAGPGTVPTWTTPGGSGTVTNVSVTTANGVSGTVATSTTTPAITLSLGAITPTSVAATGTVSGSNLSGTNTGDQITITGNAGTATALQTGRSISITGDVNYTSPSFNGTSNVTAAATVARINGNTVPANAAGALTNDGSGNLTWATAGSGTVTSVGLTLPSIFSVAGSPVTTAGTLAATLASQPAATVFAAPTAAAGAPTFRTLAATDIPNLDASKITTGALPIAQGGTGATTPAAALTNLGAMNNTLPAGEILVGNASNIATGVAVSGDATMSSAGTLTVVNNAITSAKIADGSIVDADVNAAAAIAGTKVAPNFGAQNVATTGSGTFSQLILSDEIRLGADPGTAGQVMTSAGAGTVPTWSTLAGGGSLQSAYDGGNTIVGTNAVDMTLDNGLVVKGVLNTGTIPVSGAGVKMMFYPRKAAFRVGETVNDPSGTNTESTNWDDANVGLYSVAVGLNTGASGDRSFASGKRSYANGLSSVAMGDNAVAEGNFSAAFGFASTATGQESFTAGRGTNADARQSAAFGAYNVGGGSPSSFNSGDPLFEVGNGTSTGAKSNALTILKNGNTSIKGTSPLLSLEIKGTDAILLPVGTDAQRPGSPAAGFFRYNTTGGILEYHNGGGWQAVATGAGSPLISNAGTRNLFAGTSVATVGTDNAIFGHQAGQNNNTYNFSVVMGTQAGFNKQAGSLNTLVGYRAGYGGTNWDAGANTFIGAEAGFSITSGGVNTFVGEKAGRSVTTSTRNIMIGNSAGLASTTGAGRNIFIGNDVAGTNITGSSLTIIGTDANVSGSNLTNATALGYQAIVGANNSLVLGGTGANAVNVGIGNTSPNALLSLGDLLTTPVGDRSVYMSDDGGDTYFETASGDMSEGLVMHGAGDGESGIVRNLNSNGYMAGKPVGLHMFNDLAQPIMFTTTNIERMRIQGNGNVGIGRTPAINLLEVEGNASKTTATAWLANSDRRIKTDIHDIDNSFELLKKLRPVKFKYTDHWKALHPTIEDHYYYNFIAQEFQEVFPDAVQESGEYLEGDSESILQIDTYSAQIAAIKAVQELITKVEQLEAENQKLKSEKGSLEAKVSSIEQRQQELTKSLEEIKRMLGVEAKK